MGRSGRKLEGVLISNMILGARDSKVLDSGQNSLTLTEAMGDQNVAKSHMDQDGLSSSIAMGRGTQNHNMVHDPAEGLTLTH